MTTYEVPAWREWHGTHKAEEMKVDGIIPAPGDEELSRLGRRGQTTIKFKAEVAKVQTMADGGVRVVLDLGEDGRRVMEALTECKQNGVYLAIEAIRTE